MSKKLNLHVPFLLGIFLIGIFSAPSSSKSATYYWDTTAGSANGTGGTGTFTTSGATWSTDPLGSSTLVANTGTTNDIANFQGTAGTVTYSNNLTQGSFNINTSGYTFTTFNTSFITLGSTNVTLGNNVNLNLSAAAGGGLIFRSNSIIGGTGSSITLVSGSSGKRAVLLNSGATVASSAPIIFNITGALAAGDYMALGNSSGTGTVNSAITGNSGTNNMTFYSSSTALVLNGSVSGSQGVSLAGNGLSVSGRVELNASNSYAGKTTLNGGAVYVSNNFAFSTNSIVVASNNSTIRGIGVSTNLQIANAVEFGTSGANLIIGGDNASNAISFNGVISGSGSVSAAARTGSVSYKAYLMNTNNTFNGGVFSSNGYTMYAANLGNKADTQSAIGTGAITLGNATTSGGIRWVGSAGGNEVSDKDFVLLGTNSILANGATGATLTLNGALNSTVAGNKTITLAGYNGNRLIVNGLINEFLGTTNSVTIGVSSSGTVVLGNTNNSFSGAVTIGQATADQSTVLETAQIGNSGDNSTLGKNGTINIGSSSSSRATTLRYVGTGETSDKVINLSGTEGGAILEQAGASGNLKFTSAITQTGIGVKAITLKGNTAATGELGGNISDANGQVMSLVKGGGGGGTWILSGSNSYSGTTTVAATEVGGTHLKLMGTNALSTKTVIAGSSAYSNAGTVNFGVAGDYTANSFGNSTTSGNNLAMTNSSGGVVNLTFTNANNYFTLGDNGGKTLTNSSANLNVLFNGGVDIGSSEANDVTFTGSGNFRVDGAITSTGAGVRGLSKSGAGTLTLAGAGNSYAGATAVNGGTLLLTNSATLTQSTALTVSTAGTVSSASSTRTAAATLNVASGSSLLSGSTTTVYSGGNLIMNGTAGSVVVETNGLVGGSGTFSGAVTLNSGSLLNPGNSPGTLRADSSIWKSGSTYNWEIDSNASSAVAGTNWDLFSVTTTLDLSALSFNSKMNLVLNSLSGFDLTSSTNREWVFAQAGSLVGAGGVVGTAFAAGANVTDLFNITATAFNGGVGPANGWRVEVGDTGKTLNLMAVPEPSTGSMLGLGLAGLVVTRLLRRKIS